MNELDLTIQRPGNPITQAIHMLEAAGHRVLITDIPGLFLLDGRHELTINQLMSVAANPKQMAASNR